MLQSRIRAKICGLTRIEDVQCAVQAGADAIGLVFYPGSARAVSLRQARALRLAVPAFVDVVTLFVNATPEQVRAVMEQVQPDLLQFHGDETADYCASFDHRYIRAFRVGAPGLDSPEAVLETCREFSGAAGWLFDSFSSGYGGSGLALDLDLLREVAAWPDRRPLILAGGLTPQTLASSVRTVHPYAVDVSSAVEAAPGIKSAEKINAFMAAVREASGAGQPRAEGLVPAG